MAGEPIVTYVGNVTGDPELRFTPQGKAVVNLNLAVNHRIKKGDAWEDGPTTWLRLSAWEDMAENIAETIQKGMRVIVQGRQATQEFEDKEGNKRSSLTLQIEAIGPDLRFQTAQVTKVGKRSGGGGGGAQRQSAPQAAAQPDPWAVDSQGQAFDDAPPF